MRDKQYLLTYQDNKNLYDTFAWFDTEEELNEFIKENKIHVIDAIRILDARTLLTY